MSNNSTKPLSESELAKQRVLNVYPQAWEHSTGEIFGPNENGKAYLIGDNWIDVASKLPAVSEDGSDICNHCDHMRCLHQDDNPDLGCDHHDNQGAPCGCTKFIPVLKDGPAEGIAAPLHPKAALLVKLGSMVIHVEELLSPKGHEYDRIALQQLLDDVDVKTWLSEMDKMAFLPKKR